MDLLSKALASDLARLVCPIVEEAVERALRKHAPPGEPAPQQKAWLTNREAMGYLGLSKATLARYRADGTLPFSKVGAKVYYRLADVEAILHAALQPFTPPQSV